MKRTIPLLLFCVSSLQAFSAGRTAMTDAIQSAHLLIVAEVSKGTDTQDDRWTVTPSEILKGDKAFLKQSIELSRLYKGLDCKGNQIKPGNQVLALTRTPTGEWEAVASFSLAQLPQLRCLIAIQRVKPEGARTQRLMDLVENSAQVCPQAAWTLDGLTPELSAGLQQIRDKKSFPIVQAAYDRVSPSYQGPLLKWMIQTLDSRAIPTLVRALDAKELSIRSEATSALVFDFPGAPGVTEAFRARWKSGAKDVRSAALRYLIQRDSNPAIAAAWANENVPTFYMKAEKAIREGTPAEAAQYCLQVLGDPTVDVFTRQMLSGCVATALTKDQQDQNLPLVAPSFERHVKKGNWLEAQEAVRVALSIKHPAMLRTLILSLKRRDIQRSPEERYETLMAIRAYGSDAQAMASAALLERLHALVTPSFSMDNFWPLVALSWVGTEDDLNAGRKALEAFYAIPSYRDLGASLKPISGVSDEAAYWIEMIQQRETFPSNALEWFALRLGDLNDPRAVPVLAQALDAKSEGEAKPIYTVLAKLGEPGLEQLRTRMMKGNAQESHEIAQVFCDTQKEKALPFFRTLLKTKGADTSGYALGCIGKYGTADDIRIVSPHANYWKNPQNYWPRQALTQLRERLGYDVNGPIQKN